MTAREPSAVEVIAEAQEVHGFYRLVGNPAKPSGWLCRCGVEYRSPDAKDRASARSQHVASEVLAALEAAGFVVATREQIRAMSVQEQAELIGAEVQAGYHFGGRIARITGRMTADVYRELIDADVTRDHEEDER